MEMLFCILANEQANSHKRWEDSCKTANVGYKVVDFTKNDWLEDVLRYEFTCYLTIPSGSISYFKTLYDERLYILHYVLRKKIYPTYDEILIYENKKVLSYWLKANKIPHPQTWVFYRKDEARAFAQKCNLPIVGKSSIGASGSGVHIIKSYSELNSYIDKIFSDKGVLREVGPNFRKGNKVNRFVNVVQHPAAYLKKISARYKAAIIDPQRWYAIFQEYIKCDYEWRAVRIGDSYFAHKKLGVGGKFSGSTKVGWDGPSEDLLAFVKDVCDKHNFYCQAVDIFEPRKGQFLVNEMQTVFGSENPHQMILDGKPGRYVLKDSKWVFEGGTFNTNNSYDLRLQHVLELLRKNCL